MVESERVCTMSYVFLSPSRAEMMREFSLRFCKTFMSRELAGKKVWRAEGKAPSCGDVHTFCKTKEAVTVIRPLVVACKTSLSAMESAAKTGRVDITGPLLGGGRPEQAPSLPFAYHDIESFREVSDWVAREGNCEARRVQRLAPDIFCCTGPFLRSFPENLPLSELPGHPLWDKATKGIVEMSLAHTFSGYYSHSRLDLAALVPEGAKLVLDVGCGEGGLGSRLKSQRPELTVVGVEPDPKTGAVAERIYEYVHIGQVESYRTRDGFDCIVCGDVLEHLKDPWSVLSNLHGMLKDEGILVGSCPNAGHWTVVKGLLEGRFSYVPAGILCWDHIRYFTEESLRDMLTSTGFDVVDIRAEKPVPTPQGEGFIDVVEKARLGNRTLLLAAEFIFRARKGPRAVKI